MNTTDTPANQAHRAHMAELKRQYKAGHSVQDIADYIANVRRAEGRFRGDALRAEFGAWWKEQQQCK
jgi:hypothetical protein